MALLLLSALLPRPALAVPGSAERAYAKARDRYHRNLKHPRENTPRNWERAIALFRDVATRYPSSHWAADALYSIGLSYEQKGDQKQAAAAFEAMAKAYPESRLADDALLIAATKRLQLQQSAGAEADLLRVVRQYAQGDMYPRARDRLVDFYRERRDGDGAEQLLALLRKNGDDSAARKNLSLVIKEVRAAEPASDDPLLEQRLGSEPDGKVDVVGQGESWLRAAGRPYVKELKTWSASRSTRVVIGLSEAVHFTHNRLAHPDRIYIDLQKAVAYDQGALLNVDDGTLSTARASQFDPQTARIVLQPASATVEYSVFELSNPPRIVVDLRRESEAELRYALPVGTQSLAQELGLRAHRIAIDPGHGGHDPGAIGPGGLREKDVTLSVAKALKKLLDAEGTFETFLTRDDDRFVALEKRTALANQRGADLFISIHFNAHTKRSRAGYETYYLAMAQNDEARAVAAMENAVSMKNLHDLKGLVDGILRTAHRDESRRLAQSVQASLAHGMKGNDRGVKRAGFVVLVGADMPAVLAECGFITNPQEGGRLRRPETIAQLAHCLYDGIVDYARDLTVLSEK